MALSTDSVASQSEPPQSPKQSSSPPLENFQDLMQSVRSRCQVYEDALVDKVKDEVLVAYEHPVEACAVAAVAGVLLLRGRRRFLYRNTLGRFKTEENPLNRMMDTSMRICQSDVQLNKDTLKENKLKKRLTEAESHLRVINESLAKLKKESKNIQTKIGFGEEDLKRGNSKIKAAGHEIQRLSKYINKLESQAADLMEDLRAMPGRTALELRAEVASMTSGLRSKRLELNERVTKISELGIRV